MRLPKMRTRESHSYLKIQSILKSCYALIRKIRYNFNYNIFHFIFDIVNFLDEKLEFIIEVPREALDLENVDRLIKNTLSPYETHSVYSESSLIYHLNQGSYIIDLRLIDD